MQLLNHSNHEDFILTDCLIYDGTGNAQTYGDIFVSGDRIRFVDRNHSVSHAGCFRRSLKGYAVAPGFIDVHGHSDISICACPSAFGKISQGVTTELVGNCGLSVFPVSEPVREHLDEMYRPYSEKITWNDFNGYAEEIRRRSPAINIGSLCGHNTLRASVTGYEKREISESDINAMRHHLNSCLKDGAFGFSTGLLYVPGIFSTKDEILRLMEILKQYDAVYATHLRNEGTRLLEAVAEALELAKAGSGRLQISHLKTAGKANWSKLDDVFRMIQEASDAGMKVTADRYPYTYSQTSQSVMLPAPYDTMADMEIQRHLSSHPQDCRLLENELLQTGIRSDAILTCTHYKPYSGHTGKTFQEIAETERCSEQKILVDLMKQDASGTTAAFHGLSDENLKRILSRPFVCCGSDENARPLDYSIGRSHPRAFGSFPRFLNLMRKSGIPLEEAIRRVTSLPARIFGIEKRGLIQAGYYADLVVFSPDELRDTADFGKPHSPAEGVYSVIVNGKESFSHGGILNRNGYFLRRGFDSLSGN